MTWQNRRPAKPGEAHVFEPHPRWGFQKCVRCPFDNQHSVHDICRGGKR